MLRKARHSGQEPEDLRLAIQEFARDLLAIGA